MTDLETLNHIVSGMAESRATLVAQLQAAGQEIAKLRAENERLRKALGVDTLEEKGQSGAPAGPG